MNVFDPARYLNNFLEILASAENKDYAAAMAKYMKNQFQFFGIQAPARRSLTATFIKENGLPPDGTLGKVIRLMWAAPQREVQYAAQEIVWRMRRKYAPDDMALFEFMITTKSWWDTVDFIASNLVGSFFRKYPQFIAPKTEEWMASGNLWLTRTCLLFQLKYKEATDEALLYSCISKLSSHNDFFIRKAIGWSLREYSKTNADSVQQFVQRQPLSGLSKREALKWLNRKNH